MGGGGWHAKGAVVLTAYNSLKFCTVYYQKRNNKIYILETLKYYLIVYRDEEVFIDSFMNILVFVKQLVGKYVIMNYLNLIYDFA